MTNLDLISSITELLEKSKVDYFKVDENMFDGSIGFIVRYRCANPKRQIITERIKRDYQSEYKIGFCSRYHDQMMFAFIKK